MNKELYLVYEGEYGDRYKEFSTLDIDKAISKALELDRINYRVYIDVYELDGGLVYSIDFGEDDEGNDVMNNMTKEYLKDNLINKTNKHWDC